MKLLQSGLSSSVEIRTEFAPNVPCVLLDPLHVEQVLMNLCINARYAMQGNGTLTENGVEVCERFATDPDGFDLVVLDRTMPRMTGLETAEQILKLRPDVPVVLYTGYSEHVTEGRISVAGIRALVRKPLDIPAFRTLVEELLPV